MNLQERIEALETEFNEKIKALKAEAQQVDEFPQEGDKYWCINDEGGVYRTIFLPDRYEEDRSRLKIGNLFLTKEEAQFAAEKLKVEAELRKFSRRFDADQSDCLISYEHGTGELEFRYSSFADVGAIYFESKEKAQQAIESVGRERIKKYLFGVED